MPLVRFVDDWISFAYFLEDSADRGTRRRSHVLAKNKRFPTLSWARGWVAEGVCEGPAASAESKEPQAAQPEAATSAAQAVLHNFTHGRRPANHVAHGPGLVGWLVRPALVLVRTLLQSICFVCGSGMALALPHLSLNLTLFGLRTCLRR